MKHYKRIIIYYNPTFVDNNKQQKEEESFEREIHKQKGGTNGGVKVKYTKKGTGSKKNILNWD